MVGDCILAAGILYFCTFFLSTLDELRHFLSTSVLGAGAIQDASTMDEEFSMVVLSMAEVEGCDDLWQ